MPNLAQASSQRLRNANGWLKFWAKFLLRNDEIVLRAKAAKIALDLWLDPEYDSVIPLLPRVIHGERPIMLDVGANMGQFASRLSRLFPQGCIHSFEPLPGNCAGLRRVKRWLRLNNVTVHEQAICDSIGVESLHVPVFSGGYADGALAVLEGSKTVYGNVSYRVGGVQTNTIDAFAEEQGLPHVDFIKVDTEGAEQRVIAGAMTTIERFRPAMYLEVASDIPWLIVLYNMGYQGFYNDGRRLYHPRPGEHQTNVLLLPG